MTTSSNGSKGMFVSLLSMKLGRFFLIGNPPPPNLNQTLITLIPKQDGPTSIGHFRPISLCNSSYRILSKILVHILRHLIPTLVSPLQSTFVVGRRSSNNVIIA